MHRGAGAYICGEETGLLDSLEGKRGNPRLKPPFPANQGLYQGPTLINNVETLSTVPTIIRMGGEEYAKLGVETSTGTKLVSVSGHVQRPGNYEIELGIPAREIIYGLAGGPAEGRKVKCWFPGGSSSPVLTADDLDIPYDFNSLAGAGSMLGSGAIIVVDDSTPILDVALKVAKFYRHESCGKCTPCREGTNWTVKMLERIDIRRGDADGPGDHGLGAGAHHGQLPVRARRRHGDADQLDDRQVQRRVRRAHRASTHGSGVRLMPRPEPKTITFTIDGREVQAPENTMLVDAAKHGDVEIPVFCYEPKLGQPVGACRMCLVEIEGIPKLQTGCSTPVKDGMVVYTQTERVKTAQQAVVEFLLVNHPLDCPVCDKGGECPLQDITFGWGGGISRFIEPKRHFVKPLELSPLIAIDRERCILCYRCVRFSQEISEDYQLVLLERGAHSYVATFDGHPYVAPFSGNIVELCPVGALTSRPYRFRARPWDIEGAGSVCTLCPAQCNVTVTVRDERALRVLARQNDEVDDGWLCDKGRFAYQSFHVDERITEPWCATAASCAPSPGSAPCEAAASGLKRAGAHSGRDRRRAQHQRGGLPAVAAAPRRPALPAHRLAPRGHAAAGAAPRARPATAAGQGLRPRVRPRSTGAGRRPGQRRADPRPAPAQGHPPPRPEARRRLPRPQLARSERRRRVALAPGTGATFAAALSAELKGDADAERLAREAGVEQEALRELAALLRGPASEEDGPAREVVILWGERLAAGPNGEAGAQALLEIADALGLAGVEGAGLLEIPSASNGRGLREAGVLPNAGPGLSEPSSAGRDAHAIAEGLADGELAALYLLHTDPLRDLPDGELWARALAGAGTVVAHASFLTEGIREYADVVFPAEAYAEKEGTIVHPDGRMQRLRPAIARPGAVRAEWQILAELAQRIGLDLDVLSGADGLAASCSRPYPSTPA